MTHNDSNPSDELVFRVVTGRARDSEKEEVVAWRRRAEANESEYQAMVALLSLASEADAGRRNGELPLAQTIISRAIAEAEPRFALRQRFQKGLRLGGSVAAVLALAALGMSYFWPGTGAGSALSAEFVTGMAESASVGLDDGSVVRLAPNSRLKVLQDEGGRLVALTGRAYFAVARDESRPFRVQTTAGEVRVLGTRFTLEAEGDDLRVVVVEGKVTLAGHGEDAAVNAGEMGRVVRGRPVPTVRVSDPESDPEWVGRFLAFQGTPFRDAAIEIGRKYGVEFELRDDVLGERTITAWFLDWSLDEVLEVVCPVVHAECTLEAGLVSATPRS